MRTYKQQLQQENRPRGVIGGTVLPTHRRLAIFARQSTVHQVEENIDSKEYQTEDLLDLATSGWGWGTQDVDIIDQDLGISGRNKRIDQRPGMTILFRAIKADKYGATLVSAVDRLFRDRLGTQSGLFMEACIEHNVLILTPDKAYNLNDWRDLRDFREKLGKAADYSDETIGHLLELRQRASKQGRYDGRIVPVGFIVNRTDRKNKRFIIYEPHARVVRWLFKRFRELGSISALLLELATLPYVFPEFAAGMKPEKIGLDRKGVGYGLSRDGLISILTNPVYIGTWILRNGKREVIANIPNNHPSIWATEGDVSDFYYAFRSLSPTDTDGTPFRQVTRPVRYEIAHKEPLASDTSLLRDVISSPDGPVYAVTTKTPATRKEPVKTVLSYAIAELNKDTDLQAYRTYINMNWFDGLFADRLVNIVADWVNCEPAGQSMYDALKTEREAKQQVLMDVEEQLAGYYKTIANIDAFIQAAGSVTDAKTLQKYAAQLANANANIADLEKQKSEATVLDADVEECSNLLECAYTNWRGMDLECKRRFIRLVIREVSVSVPAPHFIRILIDWRRPILHEMGLIFKRGGSSPIWKEEENTLIRDLYPHADREAILRNLPTRSWNSIKLQAEKLGIERHNQASRFPLHHALSIADMEFMEATGYTNPHEQPVLWQSVYINDWPHTSR
jgi:hypothetical protein